MWNLKRNDTDDSKWKETHRLRERTYGYRREIWGKGTVREFGMGMYTLVYLKQLAYCPVPSLPGPCDRSLKSEEP